MTELAELIRSATERLSAVGVPSARHDAEALAVHVLGVPRSRLPAFGSPTGEERSAYHVAVDRRAAREPLQHITGRAAFRHLDLAVGPGVFVPRPETEVVIDWCLAALARESAASAGDSPGIGPAVVVDLCAGSGAVALAIATERPDTVVYAVEREPAAYRWLERNVAASGVSGGRVRCVLADIAMLPPTVADLDGTVDLVVSNPPYIPLGSRPLDPEVAKHDPAAALWAGVDGLDVIRTVALVATGLLRPGGALALEHADVQGAAVLRLLIDAGWASVADHRDLTGRDRFATANREYRAGAEGD